MQRRAFFRRAGLLMGGLPAMAAFPVPALGDKPGLSSFDSRRWSSVRDQFSLTRSRIHMASFLLASHPRPVAEAIERHRRAFDEDPVLHWEEHFMTAEPAQRQAAGDYLGANPDHIALTDSTTMGLGLIYGSVKLNPGDEVVTTTHDHYSTEMALQLRAERSGATVRQVSLYDDPAQASVDEIVSRMRNAMTDRTRVLAVTWVHSSTGVKLPLTEMSRALREINDSREVADRVLFCVDGVHGLGIENATVEELGCDFFIAGTHKWLFGPRGTGIVWGRPEAWERVAAVIPSFGASYAVWLGILTPEQVPVGDHFSPGGFHSFDHRWALEEAFRFHLDIGKERVEERIHSLNTMAKDALVEMSHVQVHTPMSPDLSSGIICFDVEGYAADEAVARLHERGVVASSSPYRVSHVRLAPSLINDEDEVQATVSTVAALA